MMRKLKKTHDVSGREIGVGDTVTTLMGDVTGKVCDICRDSDVYFVRVRPLHQSYGQGMWHAADRTVWLSKSRKPVKKTAPAPNQRAGGQKKAGAKAEVRSLKSQR